MLFGAERFQSMAENLGAILAALSDERTVGDILAICCTVA